MFIFLNIFHLIFYKHFGLVYVWFYDQTCIHVNYFNIIVKYYQWNVFFISGSELPLSFLFMFSMCSTHQEVFSLQNYTNMRFHLVHLSGDFWFPLSSRCFFIQLWVGGVMMMMMMMMMMMNHVLVWGTLAQVLVLLLVELLKDVC